MRHFVDRLQQDRGLKLHGHLRPHCGGTDVRREFTSQISQSTSSRSARGTSTAWHQPRRAGRRLRKRNRPSGKWTETRTRRSLSRLGWPCCQRGRGGPCHPFGQVPRAADPCSGRGGGLRPGPADDGDETRRMGLRTIAFQGRAVGRSVETSTGSASRRSGNSRSPVRNWSRFECSH